MSKRTDRLFEEGLHRTWQDFEAAAGALLDELEDAGYPRDAFAYFVNTEERYDSALPILIRWLPKLADEDVREAIVRSLTISWGGLEVEEALTRELQRPAGEDLKIVTKRGLEYVRETNSGSQRLSE